MNDIEEDLTATLARRAATVPSPIGLTDEIRRRHGEQRRRRALVGAASGIAAVTLVAGGVTMVDLPTWGDDRARAASVAGPGPTDPVKPDPARTDPVKTDPPAPPTQTVDPEEPEPSPPASGLPGALEWPTRGNGAEDLGRRVIMDKMRAMWAEEPGSIERGGKDIAPLGDEPRLLRVLYVASMPAGNIMVLQGTDETKRAMLAVVEVTEDDGIRLISRGPVDRYRVASSDVLRFAVSERIILLTPPNATAGVSEAAGGDATFTPIPLDDGLLALPLKGGTWKQVQVRVGSTVVYQGPVLP
jgi:hypothetical protein